MPPTHDELSKLHVNCNIFQGSHAPAPLSVYSVAQIFRKFQIFFESLAIHTHYGYI